MKSKILDRPMFKQGGMAEMIIPDNMVENVGIMQGFMEPEDEYEGYEEKDEYDDKDDYEDSEMEERSPRSPEILMNNLRGDMRSVDARIDELANLVGEDVAMDTPTEVLALLQPVLAVQGGISSLPAAMPGMPAQMPSSMPAGAPTGAPDMGLPPLPPEAAGGIGALMAPSEAQAPMPTAQAPINMAKGGYVQRFQAGSDEEGVTPATTYPPELVKYAQEQLMAQRGAGNLKQSVEEVLPVYREILGGGDRRTMQGQALMDVAQAGLRLASGRNAQGARVGGDSFASQLASAAQGLPEKLAERAGQYQQEERAIKLAALKSAEAGVESQRKLFAQIVKSSGQSPFGKGDWDWAVLNRPGLLQKWTEGKVTEQEDMLIQSAITKMQSPKTEFKTDPVTKQVYQVQVPGTLPPFVAAAINKRGGAAPVRAAPTGGAQPTGTATTPAAPVILTPDQITATEDPEERAQAERLAQERGTMVVPPGATPAPKAAPAIPKEVTASTYSKNEPTFFNMAGKGTGPISVAKPFIAKIPLIGGLVDADKEIEATTFLKTAINRVTAALGETERFGSVEKAQILGQLDLLPSLIDRKEAYWQRIVGLDTMLLKASNELASTAYNKELTPATQGDARAKLDQIRQVRSLLGAPPRVSTQADFNELEIGTPFVLPNGKIQVKSAEIKRR